MSTARASTIDDSINEQRARVRTLTRLASATPRLRAMRAAYGWPAAIANALEDFDGVETIDLARVFGAVETAMYAALHRTGFAEVTRGRWSLVETEALRSLRADLALDAEERAAAERDRHLVAPWRRVNGCIKTTMYGLAMRALFADGRARSTREVTYVLRGVEIDGGDIGYVRTSLARCEDVEPAGVDTWRRVPTRDELRARIAELEAEIVRLRGER
jgi:hypothetical protein